MKKILIIGLAMIMGLASCKKYISQVPDDALTLDDIFKSYDNTDRFLRNIYYAIPNEHNQRFTGNENSGPWIAASDEGKYTWDFNYANNINSSTWNKTDGTIEGFWNRYYIAIRNATYFINNIENANPAEVSQNDKKSFKAQARALRALYYFYLLRMYGPVPILGENVLDINAPINELRLPRTPFDQGIDYVVSEFNEASKDLSKQGETSIGRITQGACKAYIAEALLLKASPLYNGNTSFASLKNPDGTQLISQTEDVTKWADAAKAAKEFIDTFVPGTYTLYKVTDTDPFVAAYLSCRNVMLVDWNKEWIFARSASNNYTQYDRVPKHVGVSNNENGSFQGAGSLGATQTMVDAYFMANGRSIDDQASGYVSSGFSNFRAPFDSSSRSTFNQWVKREPRFYVGITYNNSRFIDKPDGTDEIVTSFFYNGNSGRSQSTSDVSPTGYCVRKDVNLRALGGGSPRGALLLRLANIYLDYAEALNESNPGNTDILKYVNLIRERAGVPQYGSANLPAPVGQEAVRQAIRKERRVELAFENVRFFDTRRWKIAENTDGGNFYGMDMTKNDNTFYNRTLLETRVFRKERDYLFPIPNNEVLKNQNMVQNPGW